MLSQFGIEGSRAAQYVIAFAIILALVLLFAWVLRRLTGGKLLMSGQDRGRSRQPRLGIVDVYDLDRQRQLILLRRDNVEHLLLVGGLNDVVIETNIVRNAGSRLPAPQAEPAGDRPEPAIEPNLRPQVDPAARPNIETQLAAQLGAFIRRPSDESDVEQELAPIASVSAPVSSQPLAPIVEPALKPTRVEGFTRPVPEFEPKIPELSRQDSSRQDTSRQESSPARYEPPRQEPPRQEPPRQEPRVAPTFSAPPRPAPVPPAPPVQPEPRVEPRAATIVDRAPDAAILSDMAKQLEEALKRPTAPVPVPVIEPVEIVEVEEELEIASAEVSSPTVRVDEDEEPSSEDEDHVAEEDEEEVEEKPADRSGPASEPAAVHPPRPAAPPAAPSKPASDPFSVEEIEAEFARLLGRPTDPDKR